jgi:hypothetical protein
LPDAALLLFPLLAALLGGCSAGEDQSLPAVAQHPDSAVTAAAKPDSPRDLIGERAVSDSRGLLAYPDDLQITMLAYRLSGRAPPMEAWAARTEAVRRANEFTREDAMSTEMGRLAKVYAATEGVGRLRLRIRSRVSEYDVARGGYYLTAMAPGTQISLGGSDPVTLRLENAERAFFWPLVAARAEDILSQLDVNRQVVIDAHIHLQTTAGRSPEHSWRGVISEYALYTGTEDSAPLLARFELE